MPTKYRNVIKPRQKHQHVKFIDDVGGLHIWKNEVQLKVDSCPTLDRHRFFTNKTMIIILIDCTVDCTVDLTVDCTFDRTVDYTVDCSVDCTVDYTVDCTADCTVDC